MAERRRTWKQRTASSIRPGAPRPWWATWPAVAGWALLGVLCVLPAASGAWIYAQFSTDNQQGLDFEVAASPAAWQRWLAGAFAVLLLVVPVLWARWARKGWLGYFLLGLCIALAVLIVGLFMWRIL